jgi:hypothetical protein
MFRQFIQPIIAFPANGQSFERASQSVMDVGLGGSLAETSLHHYLRVAPHERGIARVTRDALRINQIWLASLKYLLANVFERKFAAVCEVRHVVYVARIPQKKVVFAFVEPPKALRIGLREIAKGQD